jgi:hypothetical protein
VDSSAPPADAWPNAPSTARNAGRPPGSLVLAAGACSSRSNTATCAGHNWCVVCPSIHYTARLCLHSGAPILKSAHGLQLLDCCCCDADTDAQPNSRQAYLTGKQHKQQVRRAGEGAGDLLPWRCARFVTATAHVNSKLLLLHPATQTYGVRRMAPLCLQLQGQSAPASDAVDSACHVLCSAGEQKQ